MLTDVVTIRAPAGTIAAVESAAGAAGVTVPDYCRRALAEALIRAAKELTRPVRRTRTYRSRGGIAVAGLDEGAVDG